MIFINPDCFHIYRFPSMGMMYIASHLAARGRRVKYVDPNFDRNWCDTLDAEVDKHEWVGITANVLSIMPAMEMVKYVREKYPEKKIIMGGPYPAINREEILDEYADAVAFGEAETTCAELEAGTELKDIKGLAWRDNGAAHINEARPLHEDLDALAFPDWSMGHVDRYVIDHSKRNPVLPLLTSRGCPFNCIFCASDVTFGNRIRYRSIDNVTAEVEELVGKHGGREIHIWDDNFTLRRKRVMEFCEALMKLKLRGISFKVPAGIKPDIGDYEMFRAMKRAGFYSVCVAVETGDQEIMKKLGKKVRVDKVKDVVAAARRAGLLVNGFFMLGLPFDTEETMRRNIDHACALPLHEANFFITVPFPGTELYDIVREEGKFLFHNEQNLYEDGYLLGRATCEMPGFDAETVERMFKLANRRFYFRPLVIVALIFKRIYSPMHFFVMVRNAFRILFRGRKF